MKKFYMIASCALAIAIMPALAIAGDAINQTAPIITNNGTDAAGPATVPFNPSPNVEINLHSTVSGYAITSANTLTAAPNGMEYAAHHQATGYAQRTKTTAAGTGPAGATDVGLAGIPGTDWVWMGGGGS